VKRDIPFMGSVEARNQYSMMIDSLVRQHRENIKLLGNGLPVDEE
jgi:hypothetical protein